MTDDFAPSSFFIHLLSSLEINQIEVIRMRNGHFRPLSSDYWLPTSSTSSLHNIMHDLKQHLAYSRTTASGRLAWMKNDEYAQN